MAVTIPLVVPSQIAMVAVALVFGAVASIAVVLRIWAARIANRHFDASDYCIWVAWIFTLGLMVACILEAVLGGFGWHAMKLIDTFGPDPIVQYHKIIPPLEMLWNLSLTATKLSVLLFYIKIFSFTPVVLPAKIIVVFVGLLGTSGFLSTILICRPFAYNWNLSIPDGHCGSQSAVFAVFGIMNLVTDLTVLAMPVSTLLSLQMPSWKKGWLVGTFAVGFLTCIASIVRLVYLAQIDYNDVTYTSVTAVLMTAVEPSLAVILACIPLLLPLLGPKGRVNPTRRARLGGAGSSSAALSSWWMSGTWSRSNKTFSTTSFSQQKRTTAVAGSRSRLSLLRLASNDAMQFGYKHHHGGGGGVRSAILNKSRSVLSSRYDSDDGMELKFVMSPAEGVSHWTSVEAWPAKRQGVSAREDEAIRRQIRDVEAARDKGVNNGGGISIMVKQEWHVEHELKCPP